MVEGPRRVGKTFLLHHLLAAQPEAVTTIYFEATQAGERDQLRRFGAAVSAALGADTPPLGAHPTWEQALSALAYVARRRPVLVVIDEATYLMASTPGFASQVQVVWDAVTVTGSPTHLALVLTGSAVGLMEDALVHSGPLYGRASDVVHMRPFAIAEAHEFCGRPEAAAMLEAYAACGGYPLHLDAWAFEETAQENLLRLAGRPGGLLLEDADRQLNTLPSSHRRILSAVGNGRAKPSDIAGEAGQRIDRGLESLVRARYVRAATPLGAPLKARPEYRVEDAYLRFWFRILSGGVQRIESGQGAAVLAHSRGEWQTHLGWVFEQAAREHAAHLVAVGELPHEAQVDEWWTVAGTPCQIDVLGMVEHRTAFVGEAKWSARPLGSPELDDLADRARLAPRPVPQPTLLLYGRGGVRPDVLVGGVRGYDAADVLAR